MENLFRQRPGKCKRARELEEGESERERERQRERERETESERAQDTWGGLGPTVRSFIWGFPMITKLGKS